MDTSLVIINQDAPRALEMIGAAANSAATHHLLADYQARKSSETLRRQRADIALFASYLLAAGVLVEPGAMAVDLALWRGVTWGLVDGFNRWSLAQAYAIGSVNVRLATIKTYCALAARAGAISAQELALIKTVHGYRAEEGRNVDEKREQSATRTRRPDARKAEPVSISPTHAALLKKQPAATSKGRRDALIVCLLVDHGLRVGEIAALNLSALDLDTGMLTFYRRKVHKVQIHQLTPDTWQAARAYLGILSEHDQDTPLFTGPCSKGRISERTINARIAALGKRLDIAALSPHDGRHFWATDAVRNGTDIKSLQDAGGWSSPAMPLRYAESGKIANEGVKLSS